MEAASDSLQPLMSILGGVATALILVTVVIIVTMRLRCGTGSDRATGSGENTWKTDSGENSVADGVQAQDAAGLLLHQQQQQTLPSPGGT